MFRELGVEPSVQAVAERYQDIVDLMIIDDQDAAHGISLPAAAWRLLGP